MKFNLKKKYSANSMSTHEQFAAWLQQPLGQVVINEERIALRCFWPFILGDYLLTFGVAPQVALTEEAKVKHCFMMVPSNNCVRFTGSFIVAESAYLPIQERSLQAILLPHVLEFSKDPYQLLREAEAALSPEGYLIVIGFNPWSLWGLRRCFSFKRQSPWAGVFRPSYRIKDWLRVLNFHTVSQKKLVYQAPIILPKWVFFLSPLKKLCQMFFPYLGGVYIVIAQKKVFGLTPLQKTAWALSTSIIPQNVAEPVRRGF